VPSGNKSPAIAAEVIRLLQKERETRGISKYALAETSGLAKQTISYMEREMRSPSFETILRISEALKADLGKLIAQARKTVEKRSNK
jgi:transcriptional regulator with XRE-family HTH domain